MKFLDIILTTLFIGLPCLIGYYVLYVGMRCKKSSGSSLDLSAFWFNFLAFMWLWAERIDEIVKAMPFFQKDLSETLGIRPDDGRTERGDRING